MTTTLTAKSFTPGPWRIAPPSKSTGRCIWRNDPGENPGNEGWARICSHVNSEADGIAIAALPDLIEALLALHADVAEYQHINNLGGYDNHAMRQARAALAKAGISVCPHDDIADTLAGPKCITCGYESSTREGE